MSDIKDTTAESTPTPATDIDAKLAEFGASEETVQKIKELGVESIDDLSTLTEADLTGAGLVVVKARKLLASLQPATPVVDPALMSSTSYESVLPAVQDDESWLKALKTGGVLKVDSSSVIAAIRAALAKRVGLYDIPKKLAEAMEAHAEESEEQVDPAFFAIRRQITRRDFSEVFAAIDGLDGTFVTEGRKSALLARLDDKLWGTISEFNAQLKNWQDSWGQSINPMVLLSSVLSGAGGQVLPPGMMSPPDAAVLRDSADAVKDAVNRVFAGTGVQISAALAYEATGIKKSLEDPRLPSLIGVANREQMLKKLGVAVPATYPRLENNLTRYVLGVLNLEDQAAGNEEVSYLTALYLLGNQIDWTQLGGGHGYSSLGRSALRSSQL